MPIEDSILVLCITLSTSEKCEARFSFLLDKDVIDDKEGAGLPAVSDISTSTRPEIYEHYTTTHD